MKSFFTRISKLNPLKLAALCGIWLIVICGILFLVPRNISPIISGSGVNAAQPQYLTLMPGDILTQQFTIPDGTLKNLSLVVAYEDPAQAADTPIRITVLKNGSPVMEQPLPLSAIPPSSFFTLSVEDAASSGDTYTLEIENLSGYCFTVPYTEVPNLATSEFSQYVINGIPAAGKILCSVQYVTGYSYYTACCIAFCFFLGGLVFSSLLLRSSSHRQ